MNWHLTGEGELDRHHARQTEAAAASVEGVGDGVVEGLGTAVIADLRRRVGAAGVRRRTVTCGGIH